MITKKISKTDAHKLIRSTNTPRLKCILSLLLLDKYRASEILYMKIGDVAITDLDDKYSIDIKSTVVLSNVYMNTTDLKTKLSTYTVASLITFFNQQLQNKSKLNMSTKLIPMPFVQDYAKLRCQKIWGQVNKISLSVLGYKIFTETGIYEPKRF